MLRIHVDFNWCEASRTIVIPSREIPIGLKVGTRVVLYEPGDIECEAVIRLGDTWDWAAKIVEGTIKKTSS